MRWYASIRNPAVELARARHIAEVLIRNGLGFLAESAGLASLLPPWRRRKVRASSESSGLSVPQRLRKTLEELGPTYIKLGQILSTRPDILPPEYIIELSKLLDAAPPVPLAEIQQVIEAELGKPLSELFSNFCEKPLASASIGQVHQATLADGTPVVIKIQRPGITRTIQADLTLLQAQARFLETRSEKLHSYGLTDLIQEFSRALLNELDYTTEGRNADRLRALIGPTGVRIPEILWELTTPRVLTMSDLRGIKLSETDRLRAQGYNLPELAARIVRIYLDQVFVHGFFHADPHPANILICDGQIGLVDLGVVGYLTPRMRQNLGDLVFALAQQDVDNMIHIIMSMGAVDPAYTRDTLQRDLQQLLLKYYGVSLASVPMAQFLGEIMSVAFRNHIRLPADLALLARTIVVLEGVARNLDPSLVLAEFLEPFIIRLVKERYSIKRSLIEGVASLRDLEEALHTFPRRVSVLSEQLERGELTFGIQVRDITRILRRLEAVGNRISFGVVVAALIIGSALILAASQGEPSFQLPLTQIRLPIPELSFVAAAILGAWWLLSIVRSKGL